MYRSAYVNRQVCDRGSALRVVPLAGAARLDRVIRQIERDHSVERLLYLKHLVKLTVVWFQGPFLFNFYWCPLFNTLAMNRRKTWKVLKASRLYPRDCQSLRRYYFLRLFSRSFLHGSCSFSIRRRTLLWNVSSAITYSLILLISPTRKHLQAQCRLNAFCNEPH